MNLLGALLRYMAVEVSGEIKKRDAEIEKLKSALAGAQVENREAWALIGRMQVEIETLKDD